MPQTRSLRIELTVFDRPVAVEGQVPTGQVRPDELLPFMYTADNAVIAAAVAKVDADGKEVSCRKGCSACCRAQPVPIAPAEAHAIARFVDSLPEPRRAEIYERFTDRAARLQAAGLFELFVREVSFADRQQARAAATEYFRLGLVCPFLEDDSCSIHPIRPFVCRQYLVTSPSELCDDPLANTVDVVPIPISAAGAMLKAAEPVAGRSQLTIPLVLALEYDNRHKAELERTGDAELLFRRWLGALT